MQTKISKETFSFVEKNTQELYAIRIKKGRFKGVIFTFGKVSLNENKEQDQCSVDFQYNRKLQVLFQVKPEPLTFVCYILLVYSF